MMNLSFAPAFRHRENLDGTWDSICMRCYGTAAHTHEAALLDTVESGHCCNPASWIYKEPEHALALAMSAQTGAGERREESRVSTPMPSPLHFRPTVRHDGKPAGLREQQRREA